jgi:hypothetical protein
MKSKADYISVHFNSGRETATGIVINDSIKKQKETDRIIAEKPKYKKVILQILLIDFVELKFDFVELKVLSNKNYYIDCQIKFIPLRPVIFFFILFFFVLFG